MRLALLVPLSLLLYACGGGGSAPTAPAPLPATTCPIPVAKTSPSWKTDLYPFLQATCGASSPQTCHAGASPPGHVDFSGSSDLIRTQLVSIAPTSAPTGKGWLRVAPGDTAHSWILEKVTKDQPGGSGYGTRMPQGAPNLCQPTVDTLSAWISAGAPNN